MHLVVVRGCNEYDGAIVWDVESPSRSQFSEEDIDYRLPEKESGLIGQVGG